MESGNSSNDEIVNKDASNVKTLSDEQQKMADEFNMQRARMKELFLQKEEEMRRIITDKEQLESEVMSLREALAQQQTLSENQKSEIETLQLLIHETVEASSSACSAEVRRLQTKNLELEQQVNYLHKQTAQDVALAPAAIVRTLARKLGADTDDDKKVSRHAQEEELRSLVAPLEEEISALKNKLRETDTQLQAQLAMCQNNSSGDLKSPAAGLTLAVGSCDMCQNYERQLVDEQARSANAEARVRHLDRALAMATQELESARSVHDETLREWRVERQATSTQLGELASTAAQWSSSIGERTAAAEAAAQQALQLVTALTVARQTLQDQLDTLQRDNDMLLGKYAKKASELQNDDINLPDTVEELQEQCLMLHEQLIISQLGRESLEEAQQELRAQLQQQAAKASSSHDAHQQLLQQYQDLRQQYHQLDADRKQLNELGEKLTKSSDKIEELLEDKRRLQSGVLELRSRISSLQLELDTSEKVQQDFVRLSQTLQVQLESIRAAETEVRWQNEDDVSSCPSCRNNLPTNKHKVHCRHCGRIFCAPCVAHAVVSGPRRSLAKVCALCHTLLQPHAPPHFSTEAPRPHL